MFLINNCRNYRNTVIFEGAYTPRRTGELVLTSLYPEQEDQYGDKMPTIGDRCWYAFRCQPNGAPYSAEEGPTESHANISLWEIVDLPRVIPRRVAVENYMVAAPRFRPRREDNLIPVGQYCGEDPDFDAHQLLVVGKKVIPVPARIVAFDDRLNPSLSMPEFFDNRGFWKQFSIRAD